MYNNPLLSFEQLVYDDELGNMLPLPNAGEGAGVAVADLLGFMLTSLISPASGLFATFIRDGEDIPVQGKSTPLGNNWVACLRFVCSLHDATPALPL